MYQNSPCVSTSWLSFDHNWHSANWLYFCFFKILFVCSVHIFWVISIYKFIYTMRYFPPLLFNLILSPLFLTQMSIYCRDMPKCKRNSLYNFKMWDKVVSQFSYNIFKMCISTWISPESSIRVSALEKFVPFSNVFACIICFWIMSIWGVIFLCISIRNSIVLPSSLRSSTYRSVRYWIFSKWEELLLRASANCAALAFIS